MQGGIKNIYISRKETNTELLMGNNPNYEKDASRGFCVFAIIVIAL